MNVPFKSNGKIYTAKYAWTPIKTSNDEWLWLVVYYETTNKRGEIRILSQMDYLQTVITG
jgi:hypothetical protein